MSTARVRRHCETAAIACACASPVALLVGFALLPTAAGGALMYASMLLLVAFIILLDLAD